MLATVLLVLMGDGFTQAQQGTWPNPASGTFLYQARSATNFMMNFHPFSLFSDIFIVYAVQTISSQAWASAPGNTTNRLRTYAPVANRISMTSWGRSEARAIAEWAAGSWVNVNMIQVIANTKVWGCCMDWASFNKFSCWYFSYNSAYKQWRVAQNIPS